jgi:hypothetical protein
MQADQHLVPAPPRAAKRNRSAVTKLPQVSHRFGRSWGHDPRQVMSRGVSVVLGDLQMKLEKYERKAAQYEKAAQQATDGPERALYQGLASYCDELAGKFRQVIAKRTGASLAAE